MAVDPTKHVANTATEQARDVADHAAAEARHLVHETRNQLREQARGQTAQLADGLHRLGDQARALVDGRQADAGMVGDYARQFAGKLGELADRVDERGFDGIVADVKQFARRRPGAFLLGALVGGFAVGRVLRSAQAAGPDHTAGPALAAPPPLHPHVPQTLASSSRVPGGGQLEPGPGAPRPGTAPSGTAGDPFNPLPPVGAPPAGGA